MEVEKLLATLGQKQLLLETQDAAYTSLLGLLGLVVDGKIDPKRIQIDQTARTWKLAEVPAEQKQEETDDGTGCTT